MSDMGEVSNVNFLEVVTINFRSHVQTFNDRQNWFSREIVQHIYMTLLKI